MNGTYFDYVISQVRGRTTEKVYSAYGTKQELIDSMNQFPELSYSVKDTVLMTEYLAWRMQKTMCRNLSADAEVIRQRVEHSMNAYQDVLHQGRNPDYDELFDRSVECCWLLGSIERQGENARFIKLIVDPQERLDYAWRYLHNAYNQAVRQYNEIIYISEALETRKHIFAGLHMPSHEEAREYLSYDEYTYDDLCAKRNFCRDESNHILASYYSLTATLMLANQIRRGII